MVLVNWLFYFKVIEERKLFKMFKCDICENTFTRERDMRRHKKNIHEKTTRVCCNKFQKSFTRFDSLRAH